jgi:hypothetical protein
MKFRYAHLSAGFMLTSIIGFFISIFLIMKMDETWGFTFALFFVLMFISSVISMTKAEFREKEYQDELAIHETPNYKKKR